MNQKPRILLAGLIYETNTFVEIPGTIDNFRWKYGNEMLTGGPDSPLAKVVTFAESAGWELIPTVDARATAGGMTDNAVFEAFWKEFQERTEKALKEAPIDGILLILHGAMVTSSYEDAEGELLRRVRSINGCGQIPLHASLDLHGNFTENMARLADGWITYLENPHTDALETTVRSAKMLERHLTEGLKPKVFWKQTDMLWPAIGTATNEEPMQSLELLARQLEKNHPSFLSVNVMAGFAHADIRDAGVSFHITSTGPEEEANEALNQLDALARSKKEFAHPTEWELDEAIARAAQGPFPALLVEPADNIGGGTPGDNTEVIQAMYEANIPNSAAVLNDPTAVAELFDKPLGYRDRMSFGGRGYSQGNGALSLDFELIRKSDGIFTLEDPHSHMAGNTGSVVKMGPCVLVQSGCLTLLLTSIKTAPFDLGQWRSQGCDPSTFSLVNIKAAVAHRQGWKPVEKASYTISVPGPCASDLRRLPFRNVRRPIHPLD
tara:strand:- start:2506 stop:3987 length:1482 start_codon:yes stop_codon:yes gene_type:complete